MSEHPLPEKTEDVVKFPELPNGPAVFYDSERAECWVGVPFKQIDNALFVTAFLDRAKWDVLSHLQRYQQFIIEAMKREQAEKSKIIIPGAQKAKKTISDILSKAKNLVS